MKKSRGKASKPNTNNQSYQHMLGQILDAKDHPAFNLPDPAAGSFGPAANASAPMQTESDEQGMY